jgi:N6-adenosine-specific RNA methylase IME4
LNFWFFEPLQQNAYDVIVVDPPLRFNTYSYRGERKSAQAQYRVMTDAEVIFMPVRELAAPNCLLLLWATAPKLPLAVRLLDYWGFTYKSVMMWRKTTKNGKVRLGTGFRVRSTGEMVLIATRGNPKQAYAPPTIFDGLARQHSRKPDEFYAIAERMMPNARRADLFSREQRPGWDGFGDQQNHFEAAA